MVGGHRPATGREVLYRFRFPERPGFLEEFLTHLKGRWSISLFHYHSHGAAYGRFLAGFLVPESDQPEFEQFLQATAYPCQAVDDPACELFVGERTLEREHAVDASLPG